MIIRKCLVLVEETAREQGRDIFPPIRRAVAACVLHNPFAGRYVEDLAPLIEAGATLGAQLAARAVAALGIPGGEVHSFGKTAVVGEAGELEHAAALLHPQMGAPVRAALDKGPALIPSATRTPPSSAAISTPSSSAAPTHPWPTKSCSAWRSPRAGGPCRASAGWGWRGLSARMV